MRMGKVCFAIEYPVDLDNEEMVDLAKDALCDDMQGMFQRQEISGAFTTREDTTLVEGDIPSFITDALKEDET